MDSQVAVLSESCPGPLGSALDVSAGSLEGIDVGFLTSSINCSSFWTMTFCDELPDVRRP